MTQERMGSPPLPDDEQQEQKTSDPPDAESGVLIPQESRPYPGGRTLYSWECCICGFVNKTSRIYGKRLVYPRSKLDTPEPPPILGKTAPWTFQALCQNHKTEKCAGKKPYDADRLGVNHIRCARCLPRNGRFYFEGRLSRRVEDGIQPALPAPLEMEVFKTFLEAGGKLRPTGRRRSEEFSQDFSPYQPEKGWTDFLKESASGYEKAN